MGKINKKRVDKALKNANILEILNSIGIKYTKKSNRDVWFSCHLFTHRTDTKASSHIIHNRYDENHAIWYCFGCKQKGTIIDMVQNLKNVPFKEALMMVEHHQHSVLLNDNVKPFYTKRKIRLPSLFQSPDTEEEWDKKFLDYLYNRNIEWWQIKRHNIGYCDSGKYSNRIIVPVTLGKKLVTYVARAIIDDKELNKVLNALNGTLGLFNSDYADFKKPAIISEGWADALAIERCGYYNSFSTQINFIGLKQITFLEKFPYLIIIPDNDSGGIKFVNSVSPYIEDTEILIGRIPKNRKDPDECKSNEIEECISKAKKWKPIKDKIKFLIDY